MTVNNPEKDRAKGVEFSIHLSRKKLTEIALAKAVRVDRVGLKDIIITPAACANFADMTKIKANTPRMDRTLPLREGYHLYGYHEIDCAIRRAFRNRN